MQCVYDLWSLSGGVAVWWMCQYEYFMTACVYVEHIWCQSGGLWLPLWVCFTPRWPKLRNFQLLSRFHAILSKFLKEIRFSTPLKLPSIQFGPKKPQNRFRNRKNGCVALEYQTTHFQHITKRPKNRLNGNECDFETFTPHPNPKLTSKHTERAKNWKPMPVGCVCPFYRFFYVRS